MLEKDAHRLNRQEILKRRAWINLLRLAEILLQGGLFACLWMFLCGREFSPTDYQTFGLIAAYVVLFTMMARIYGGFEVNSKDIGEITFSLGIAQLFALAFEYFIVCLVMDQIVNPVPFLPVLAAGIAGSAISARIGVKVHRKLFPPQKTYVIYDYMEPAEFLRDIKTLWWKFRIVETVSLSEGMDRVLGKLDDAEAVILCGVHSTDRNTILKACVRHGVQMYIKPKIGDLLLSSATQLQLLNLPVLHCGCSRSSLSYEIIKRLMDIVLSGIALVVLSPVMAVVAIMIRSYDSGPAVYRQVRLTQDGQTFEILKFRSMRVDAEKDGVARLAAEGDDRITPVGKFIRACRLDELPQLINILKGEMSIVGPRPERPEIAAQYEEEMPEFGLRLQAKAGLTGYAQVYGKYNTKPYDKLQMDLLYIAKQSIWQDIKLIFVTFKVLFMKESAEGVSAGQVTASDSEEKNASVNLTGKAG